jgi:hypothetical protein
VVDYLRAEIALYLAYEGHDFALWLNTELKAAQVQSALANLGVLAKRTGLKLTIVDEYLGLFSHVAKLPYSHEAAPALNRAIALRTRKPSNTVLATVTSLTIINEPTQVYDFVVPSTHSFSANGLMQHNTALELTLMTNMARLGYSPAMLQLELTETQISERLASNLGNVNSEIIRSGNINEKYQKIIIDAAEEFNEELKIAKSRLTFFTPSSATIQECEYAFKTFKYDVWFIDYINLLKWEGGGKERSGEDWTRLSDIVKEFKRLAKKYGVAVVLAVQVNIDKDSGDIEIRYAKAMKEHADVVLVWNLDSNARKDGVVWLRHLKARQYEGFDFPIRVALQYCRFESVNMAQMPKVEERKLGSKGKIRREREETQEAEVFQRKTKALPDAPSATKVPVAPEHDEDVMELMAKANKRAAIPLDDEEERYKELDDD